ncbi:glycosyltransferase [Microbacterium hominis]|uniref:Glycosyl transferase n=1 Tax=Microbacterium hominis TaxID=162426 RepID=A0A7D4U8H1_9MICO|nr:glycosyltransferase [Microbacterium hominis]QKJ20006.1 glycosyl transferase [Microbacterium hominis]
MPARVHALLVVRPDGRAPVAFHLRRTLAAVAAQTRPVDDLTIVFCGEHPAAEELAAAAPAEAVIAAPATTRFAAALSLATPRLAGDTVWLLSQDTAPEPDALARLAGALELSPSLAFAAPKLVRWDDRSQIVSLGVGMTRFGAAVELAAGEFDQGQHDAAEDVLGADVRGILVRADAWSTLRGLDPALAGADEGLDLGVRARLAGKRVGLVPTALVAVAGDGVAGPAAPVSPERRRRLVFAGRVAQLHRRLVYAPLPVVVLHWLSLLPLALWRTVLQLLAKEPGAILPEWGAAAVVAVRPFAVARARRRIATHREASWGQLAPLRVSWALVRERREDEPDDSPAGAYRRSELNFFSGGGAWLVLGMLVLSVIAFPALLAWPVLGGGALAPMRATVAQLWADAAYGVRALGLDTVGPADPFAAVVAAVGSLSPLAPSLALVVLWVLALPLAALGGWVVSTRVTDRAVLRLVGGTLWALSPTFLTALTDGRPTAVLTHLLLPWLFYAGVVAHRSWVAAGSASLLLAAVVACTPSLAPALVVLVATAIVLTLSLRAGRGLARVVWMLVPAAVLGAPLVWHALAGADPWSLVADPGVVWAGPQVAADAAGRSLLAAGIPTPDFAGWAELLPEGPTWWVPLLTAPLFLLALAAPITQRWAAGITMLGLTVLGVATAFFAAGVSVSFVESTSVALWPGAGLSLAWLGLVSGALVSLDAGLAPRVGALRGLAAVLVCAAVATLAVPAFTSMARGTSFLTNGPASTLPAYIAAEGRDDPDIGTIVLTPQPTGGVAARVVWGGSETLGSQATIVSTRTSADADDRRVAVLAADLITLAADDVVADLRAYGIGFVVLAPAPGEETSAARALRLSASTALDQREGLDAVGDTAKGSLWRVARAPAPRPAASAEVERTAQVIALTQLIVVGVALLLAIPTAAARRAARRSPRVVGPHWEEGR